MGIQAPVPQTPTHKCTYAYTRCHSRSLHPDVPSPVSVWSYCYFHNPPQDSPNNPLSTRPRKSVLATAYYAVGKNKLNNSAKTKKNQALNCRDNLGPRVGGGVESDQVLLLLKLLLNFSCSRHWAADTPHAYALALQERPTTVSKETYSSVKRDLLHSTCICPWTASPWHMGNSPRAPRQLRSQGVVLASFFLSLPPSACRCMYVPLVSLGTQCSLGLFRDTA